MNQPYFFSLNFVNNLRAFNHQNDDAGRYNALIVSTIKKFAQSNFNELLRICSKDDSIAEICALPIPELQEYWAQKLTQLNIEEDENSTNFNQILLSHSSNSLTQELSSHNLMPPQH